jgi:hypothetical protein
LPSYMIPSAWMFLSTMPLNSSGKIDRKQLPVPSSPYNTDDIIPPSTVTENVVHDVVALLLNQASICTASDIYTLGFNSLLAALFVAEIKAKIGKNLALSVFFTKKSIREIAQLIDGDVVLTSGSPASQASSLKELHEDCKYTFDLSPSALPFDVNSSTNPENIFLTGSTGFVGIFLLHRLLQETKSSVICMVRSSSVEQVYSDIIVIS